MKYYALTDAEFEEKRGKCHLLGVGGHVCHADMLNGVAFESMAECEKTCAGCKLA